MIKSYLSAADIMNYLYCPRIIYFTYVLKQPQVTTIKEYKGREKYALFEKKSKRNKIIKELPYLPKRYNTYFVSHKHRVHTLTDCIAVNKEKGEAYPIQVKYSEKPRALYQSQRFQIVLEAFLIEVCLGLKVPYGYIKFLKSNDFVKVPVTRNDKVKLLQILQEIDRIIATEYLPEPTKYRKRCLGGCYRNIYC